LYQWRHVARAEAASELNRRAVPDFVPIVTASGPGSRSVRISSSSPVIEIKLAGAEVRVGIWLDDAQLTAVLRAVRASASGS
jgi:hypothetical protein